MNLNKLKYLPIEREIIIDEVIKKISEFTDDLILFQVNLFEEHEIREQLIQSFLKTKYIFFVSQLHIHLIPLKNFKEYIIDNINFDDWDFKPLCIKWIGDLVKYNSLSIEHNLRLIFNTDYKISILEYDSYLIYKKMDDWETNVLSIPENVNYYSDKKLKNNCVVS